MTAEKAVSGSPRSARDDAERTSAAAIELMAEAARTPSRDRKTGTDLEHATHTDHSLTTVMDNFRTLVRILAVRGPESWDCRQALKGTEEACSGMDSRAGSEVPGLKAEFMGSMAMMTIASAAWMTRAATRSLKIYDGLEYVERAFWVSRRGYPSLLQYYRRNFFSSRNFGELGGEICVVSHIERGWTGILGCGYISWFNITGIQRKGMMEYMSGTGEGSAYLQHSLRDSFLV